MSKTKRVARPGDTWQGGRGDSIILAYAAHCKCGLMFAWGGRSPAVCPSCGAVQVFDDSPQEVKYAHP